MKTKLLLTLACVCMLSTFLWCQQKPDLDFEPKVQNPYHAENETVTVGIDAGHNNLHQLDGGFAPFAKLLKADGYTCVSVPEINKEQLSKLDIFVVVNPIHDSNQGNWKRPVLNAFEPKELELLKTWVEEGGSLLVIADHMPCAGAAISLAATFDFKYIDGFVIRKNQKWPPDQYSKEAGTLFENEMTAGVNQVTSFTGSALKVPKSATKVAKFPDSHQLLIPEVAWEFKKKTKKKSVDGYHLGGYQPYGKGRIAFFTEAAMFTAQVVRENFKVGFNSPDAPENQQFVLNVIHWLDPKDE